MNKDQSINLLDRLIRRIVDLESQRPSSEAFQEWHQDVKTTLKRLFPHDTDQLHEFELIPFAPKGMSNAIPISAVEHSYLQGLASARAFLRSRITDIRQFSSGTELCSINEAPGRATNSRLVFVIHGRQKLGDFHAFLRAINLQPLEWSQARKLTEKTNPYTWEIVDLALKSAGAIVALFTADDEARLSERFCMSSDSDLEKIYLLQPRQNVLFEAGVAYGRSPNRTVIVRIGSQRPMSDLAGHHILTLDDSPASRQATADALRLAGCAVDLTGTDWFTAGRFG
jgi:predicted nucleotide-binding protein